MRNHTEETAKQDSVGRRPTLSRPNINRRSNRTLVIWLRNVGISLSVLTVASSAFACGGVFDVACNLSHGGMSPDNIARQTQKAGQDAANAVAKAGQDVANALNELQASTLTGPVLEQAIISSHNTAINGAMPIPPRIRQQLSGYASEDSMNRVRYKIGDNGFVNLARLLEQGGAASAVTLIDVVIFRGPSEAEDPALWAHELTHVDQYRDWGVHSFAVQYARNANRVENPAYAKQDGFLAWAQQNQPIPPQPGPALVGQTSMQGGGGWPRGFATQGCGCWGPTTGFNPDQRCASGGVTVVACAGTCNGGGPPYAWLCQ
jgi:hypothetical protein